MFFLLTRWLFLAFLRGTLQRADGSLEGAFYLWLIEGCNHKAHIWKEGPWKDDRNGFSHFLFITWRQWIWMSLFTILWNLKGDGLCFKEIDTIRRQSIWNGFSAHISQQSGVISAHRSDAVFRRPKLWSAHGTEATTAACKVLNSWAQQGAAAYDAIRTSLWTLVNRHGKEVTGTREGD